MSCPRVNRRVAECHGASDSCHLTSVKPRHRLYVPAGKMIIFSEATRSIIRGDLLSFSPTISVPRTSKRRFHASWDRWSTAWPPPAAMVREVYGATARRLRPLIIISTMASRYKGMPHACAMHGSKGPGPLSGRALQLSARPTTQHRKAWCDPKSRI